METPFLRAKAKDAADELDNTVAYLDDGQRIEVEQNMFETFKAIEQVLMAAQKEGTDPVAAYETFLRKFTEYYHPV
jgi:hypothetical protein